MTTDLRTLTLIRFAMSLERLRGRVWNIAELPTDAQSGLLQFVADELHSIASEAAELVRAAESKDSCEAPLPGFEV